MERPPDLIKAVSTLVDHAEQQQLFLSELKRVGTQQEQLKKAVSEAIALADAQGTTLEIAHLNSFPANTNLQMQDLDSRKSTTQDQQQQLPAVMSMVDQAQQQQLLLSELKRVGTQQEQLKKAVSEAIALADAQGESLEIAHLKSFPANLNFRNEQPDHVSTSLQQQPHQRQPHQQQQQQQQQQPQQQRQQQQEHRQESTADSDREAEQVQMELLFAELKRIEGQQQMLKTAVAQNKLLVVMPPAGFDADDLEDEYAEEVTAKPDPDRFIPSGGLTGFAVAKDLMKLDFSTPEEAPEEFRAVTFSMPPAKKGMRMPSLTALEIQTQGSFGMLAEPGMKMFLKRLQEDQDDMLALIKQREKARSSGLAEPQLPTLKVPAPAVDWDLPNTPPSRVKSAAVEAFVAVAAANAPSESDTVEEELFAPAAVTASGQSVKPAVKKTQEPAQSRFGAAAAAAAAASAAEQASDAQTQVRDMPSTAGRAAFGMPSRTAADSVSTAGIAYSANLNQLAGDAIKTSRVVAGGGDAATAPKQEQDAAAAKAAANAAAAAQKQMAQDMQAAAKKKKELDADTAVRKKQAEKDAEAAAKRKKKEAEAEAAAKKKKDKELAAARKQAAKAAANSHVAAEAADRAAALNAKLGDEAEDEDDVELTAEEMGFPTEAGDAFAAMKAKMEVAQGKKKGDQKVKRKG